MHLCDAPVQDRNEERLTSDSSGQGLCKSAVTSRGITKLTISAVLCVCISKQWWWGVLETHPEEINQVMWGFQTTVCGLISLWNIGYPVEMLDEARAGPPILKRPGFFGKRKRLEGGGWE